MRSNGNSSMRRKPPPQSAGRRPPAYRPGRKPPRRPPSDGTRRQNDNTVTLNEESEHSARAIALDGQQALIGPEKETRLAGTLETSVPANHCSSAIRDDESEPLDLVELVGAHLLQSSNLASLLAITEGELLDFSQDDSCPDPATAIKLLGGLEQIRRSAVGDVRRSARLMVEMNRGPTPVQVAFLVQAVLQQNSRPRTGRLLDGGSKNSR